MKVKLKRIEKGVKQQDFAKILGNIGDAEDF